MLITWPPRKGQSLPQRLGLELILSLCWTPPAESSETLFEFFAPANQSASFALELSVSGKFSLSTNQRAPFSELFVDKPNPSFFLVADSKEEGYR